MKVIELAAEYRESGELCFRRVAELLRQADTETLSESERLALRRRISALTAMGRDALATARYLENYYRGGGKGHGAD